MKAKCQIVRDLMLPYTECLASPESCAHVEEHIAICPDCAQAMQSLKFRLPDPALVLRLDVSDKVKERYRYYRRRNWQLLVAILVLLAVLLVGILY